MVQSRLTTNQHDVNHYANNTNSKLFGNVTVIITSCGRWDELSLSIESFEKYNTYSYINNRIIMDDCPHTKGFDFMHNKYNTKYGYNFYHTTTPLPSKNDSNIKYRKVSFRCIASFYEALIKYVSNDTEWIFQSEDDWLFYRYSFIEYSFEIYNDSINSINNNNKLKYHQISFISLKNTQQYPPKQDMRDFCGGPYVGNNGEAFIVSIDNNDILKEKEIKYYIAQSNDCYAHYAASPGLRHKLVLMQNMEICLSSDVGVMSYERCIGCKYMKRGFATASMRDNGFVGHLGHSERHISIQKVMGNINKTFPKIDIKHDLNKLIPLNDGWYLNQSVCTYIRLNINTSITKIDY